MTMSNSEFTFLYDNDVYSSSKPLFFFRNKNIFNYFLILSAEQRKLAFQKKFYSEIFRVVLLLSTRI